MKRLLFSFSVLLLLPNISFAFSDVPSSHRFSEDIQYVEQAGIVEGYSDGTYRPDATINRAEFTKIIIASLFSSDEINACDTEKYSFPDVPKSEWYSKFLCTAKKNGIINGYADGNFLPNGTITLPEAMKILTSANKIDVSNWKDGMKTNWYAPYLEYFKMVLVSGDSSYVDLFPALPYSPQPGDPESRNINYQTELSQYYLDMAIYKISRGEMAYFIQRMETLKENIGSLEISLQKKSSCGTVTLDSSCSTVTENAQNTLIITGISNKQFSQDVFPDNSGMAEVSLPVGEYMIELKEPSLLFIASSQKISIHGKESTKTTFIIEELRP